MQRGPVYLPSPQWNVEGARIGSRVIWNGANACLKVTWPAFGKAFPSFIAEGRPSEFDDELVRSVSYGNFTCHTHAVKEALQLLILLSQHKEFCLFRIGQRRPRR